MLKLFWNIFKKKKNESGTKQRVAILGGSFDPVHNGHTQIVRNLMERFDRVIVVPAKISPFKLDRETANANDRLSMLRLAFSDMSDIEISDYELKNGGISYSYLTAKYFSNEKNSMFYVIGSEMLKDLDKWKNFGELKKLTAFYVIPREGYGIEQELLTRYENLGAKLKLADFSVCDISSTMIRVDMAFGGAKAHLDQKVYDYIKKYNLYSDYLYITQRYEEFGMKPKRIEHTFRAVTEGVRLAKIHSGDVEKVVTALLLHDIGKYIGKKELIKKYTMSNFEIDEEMPEDCRHALIGAKIAKHCFGITDEEILKAIEVHSTSVPFMGKIQMIVAIADYIESGRDFDGIEQIRSAAEKDLNICMELMLKNMIEYLDGKKIYKPTIDAYDYFRMLNSQQ